MIDDVEPSSEDTTPQAGEPIYPMGPALRVPADAVQLTLLDLPAGPAVAAEEEQHPGFELKSPLGVRLPVFEGPLDLLFYLIRRDQLDIYDIPIAHITEQYLGMLGLLEVLDLEVAGDFLVMAATLMRLKARMLLPTWPEGEEEDEEDPRTELVRQLLEYRQFKEAARRLQVKEEERRQLFGRGFIPEVEPDTDTPLEPVSHFLLIDVLKDVLARVGEEFFYRVELEDVTLEEKMELVLGELREQGRVLFVDLVSRTPRRVHIVVTFMAILELARLGRLVLAQEAPFSQIWIYRSAADVPASVVAGDAAMASHAPAPEDTALPQPEEP
jgi:segregation and condensation protein A